MITKKQSEALQHAALSGKKYVFEDAETQSEWLTECFVNSIDRVSISVMIDVYMLCKLLRYSKPDEYINISNLRKIDQYPDRVWDWIAERVAKYSPSGVDYVRNCGRKVSSSLDKRLNEIDEINREKEHYVVPMKKTV